MRLSVEKTQLDAEFARMPLHAGRSGRARQRKQEVRRLVPAEEQERRGWIARRAQGPCGRCAAVIDAGHVPEATPSLRLTCAWVVQVEQRLEAINREMSTLRLALKKMHGGALGVGGLAR